MEGNSFGRRRSGGAKARRGMRAMIDQAVAAALRGRGGSARGGRGPVSRRGNASRRGLSMAPGPAEYQDVDYGLDVDEESSFRRGSRGPLRVGHRM